ncbi:hypothetical protein FEM48_Zijuj07G0119000 [Ziziphus jujuba var. spinosa]|uniref:KIB1-4 beta-propeller domain-containing protein n=1 Tax=Ziziphus jujuba var. spinosa TaxID=714518 RepID=A0A978V4H1_ZIZJJ|nr:hypothetical protein FEM48_Zijuj07G0119000 [Ziziphus jujuba var. spinosa]
MACQNGRPNWLELHFDLLELILKKRVPPDIVRFKSGCSLWKTAAESYMASPTYAPLLRPLLMLHNSQQQQQQEFEADNSSSLFYSLAEKKARIQLATTPQYRNHIVYIYLRKDPDFPNCYIHKAVLLSDPSHGKNFILVVIFRMAKNLAFCKYRENKWKHFSDKEGYNDILGHSSGQLNALFKSVALEIWDFQGGSNIPRIVKRVKCSTPLVTLYLAYPNYFSAGPDRRRMVKVYLVEYSSLGEVLMVFRVYEFGRLLLESKYYSSVQFIVFSMDFNAEKWVNVKELLSKPITDFPLDEEKDAIRGKGVLTLLDRAIFLNTNESISVSTRDLPECQENSIYFTDDYADWQYGRRLGMYNGHDLGVYNFKQDEFTSRDELYSMKSTDLQPPNCRCFWFVPT